MRQGSDGDQVYARFGDAAHGFEVDPTRRLQRWAFAGAGAFFWQPNGTAQGLEVHVVEQEDVGTSAEGVGDLVKVAGLYLNGEIGMLGTGCVDGLGEIAGEGDVILLDQDRVVEAHAVVAATAC